jgi:thioredoxin 1
MSESVAESSFDTEVLRSPVPVLVDFWAPWCGPCRVQLPIVDEIAKGVAVRAHVVTVNIDEQPELARRFGVVSIPTLLVFSQGRLWKRFVGVQPASTLRLALQAAGAEG